MADIELVIKIPEEMYKKIKETNMVISGRRSGKSIEYTLINSIISGVPLPKRHGRLIDADEFQRYCFEKNFDRRLSDGGLATINMFLEFQEKIIEADKEGDDVRNNL